MNVYDFDKTIYNGDSTFDFYRFSLKRHPEIALRLPSVFINFFKYKVLKVITKTKFKENMYQFLNDIDNIDEEIELFWSKNIHKIKRFYINQKRDDDVIISASPEFLVIPACEKIGIKNVMASIVNKQTGKYTGVNCHGEEKVRRFYERYGKNDLNKKNIIENFYSDSYSDAPLARLAENESYIVKGEKLEKWKF